MVIQSELNKDRAILTDAQIKKLAQAHKKGAAYTIQIHPEQVEKHGAGIFGDIKKLAISKEKIVIS
jgi:hypothetical protein